MPATHRSLRLDGWLGIGVCVVGFVAGGCDQLTKAVSQASKPGGYQIDLNTVVGLITSVVREQATKAERERAEREAMEAKARLEEQARQDAAAAERLRQIEEQNKMLAVRVNDLGDRMIVNPRTGEPATERVYSVKQSAGGAPVQDGTQGRIDDFDVVFVD